MLREMSQSDWLGWMEWLSIRGPIGGPRTDFYTSYLAMHTSGPHAKEVPIAQFKMPWIKEEDL
jgi:hypothetical protein